MLAIADFCIFRAVMCLMIAAVMGGALYALPDMQVTHTGNVINDGEDYEFTPIQGATFPMGFVINNIGTNDLHVGLMSLSSNPKNCSVSFFAMPSAVIAPGGSSTFAIMLGTPDSGDYRYSVTINSDDPDANPYFFRVEGTVPGGGGDDGPGGGGGGCAASGGGNWAWLAVLAGLAEIAFLARIGFFSSRD